MRVRLTRRGRASARVVATIMVVAAIALAVAAGRGDESVAAAPADERRAATPLLSPRRLPHVFTDEVARRRLQDSLIAFAARVGPDVCIAVDDADPDDGLLAEVNPATALAPASTIKLLTGAAALETLGPDHVFTTRVLLDSGTVFLAGGADPLLTTPEYEARLRANPNTETSPITPLVQLADDTARALREREIASVASVVGDGSRHDDVDFLPGWRESYRDDIGPLGALAVDDGFEPAGRAADAAASAAARFAALLTERGITVGGASAGRTPAGAREIASITSPTLATIVGAMLTSSDNFTAEMLLREVGLARGGAGTTAAGATATVDVLTDLGVPTGGLAIRDGSGLHPDNRVACETLLAVLRLPGPRFDALDDGLAVAARTGTLRTRVPPDDPLAGVLRAKTGQIRGVASLAGVVDDAEGLRFAFESAGAFSTSEGNAHQTGVARLVAAYPDAPPASELVPAP